MISKLWILNSSLVGILLIGFLLSTLLKVEQPRAVSIRLPLTGQALEKKDEVAVPIKVSTEKRFEKIYQQDIFETFIPKEEKVAKQTFISPIPDFSAIAAVPAPNLPVYDFIAPLDITLKGIIMSDDEIQCVAMIEDDTKKESLYHIGDKIKDAQVIKIARNRVVFLRGANGQLETCFLRKDESLNEKDAQNRWKYIIRLVRDGYYEVDPMNFKEEVDSLGNFLERASVVGAVYQKGNPIGVKIGSLDKDDLGEVLGLQAGDIITSINDKQTAQLKDRMSIYNMITEAQLDTTITVTLQRAGVPRAMNYKLTKINKAKPTLFGGKDPAKDTKAPEANLVQGRLQEREKLIRDFRQKHQSSDQSAAVAQIRQRLLENLKTRLKDNRVR